MQHQRILLVSSPKRKRDVEVKCTRNGLTVNVFQKVRQQTANVLENHRNFTSLGLQMKNCLRLLPKNLRQNNLTT